MYTRRGSLQETPPRENSLRLFEDSSISAIERCYILHSTKNIYPKYGEIRDYYELPQADNKEIYYNQKALDGFTK